MQILIVVNYSAADVKVDRDQLQRVLESLEKLACELKEEQQVEQRSERPYFSRAVGVVGVEHNQTSRPGQLASTYG